MGERDEEILDFIVRDYIRSAFPVSSARVGRGSRLEVSPASIRNKMFKLDEEGFLEQPHTSAGRAPTDKAYRYFVDYLMESETPLERERILIDGIVKKIRREHELLFEHFVKILAENLGLFAGIASFGAKPRFAGFGFEEVLKEPEFEERKQMLEFAKLIDNLGKISEGYREKTAIDGPEVFIGSENPFREARDFSAVAVKFVDEELGECIVFSLGPKRMDYERISSVLDFATRDIMERI